VSPGRGAVIAAVVSIAVALAIVAFMLWINSRV
jgi:hypothetical protein